MFKKQKNSKNTFLRSGTFNFLITYNCVIEKIGGAFMLSALCMTGVLGFLEFLKSAVFVVRIYSRRKFISGTFNFRRRKILFNTDVKGR